ncbi:MAG: cupin domain-containing protein [Gemmatimonadales bacterium]
MSSLRRELDGDVRIHHLTQDQRLIEPSLLARHGRSARTLVKEGPLRLTIVAIAPGGTIPAHTTDGPITIHVLEGEVTVSALKQEYALGPSDVLALGPGLEHAVRSALGGVFLLTVVHQESGAP